MGFAEYGNSILKNNRRLLRSVKKKGNKRRKHYVYANRSNDNSSNDSNLKNIKTKKVLFNTLLVLSIGMFFGFISLFIMGKFIDKELEAHNKQLTELQANKERYQDNKAYQASVELGNRDWLNGDINTARRHFQSALNIRPKGTSAILGLTKCLLLDCRKSYINCELAQEYYTYMINSEHISEDERKSLVSLKSQ